VPQAGRQALASTDGIRASLNTAHPYLLLCCIDPPRYDAGLSRAACGRGVRPVRRPTYLSVSRRTRARLVTGGSTSIGTSDYERRVIGRSVRSPSDSASSIWAGRTHLRGRPVLAADS
jgi:hypothetical protein